MMDYSPSFPFPIRELESERVKLTLFDPVLHAAKFVEKTKDYPELFKYLPYGPFDSIDEFWEKLFKVRIVNDQGSILFAIFDKTVGSSPRLAGVVGLLNTDAGNQSTEIGYVTTLPEFQQTHVTSNAVGLLLHYCLELPSASAYESEQRYGPGLGLRRVQWQTHAENERSARAAERMGFTREGIIRWQRVLPVGKYGSKVTPEREMLCKSPGRHTCMLSLCWDDWEIDGKREVVRQQMERL